MSQNSALQIVPELPFHVIRHAVTHGFGLVGQSQVGLQVFTDDAMRGGGFGPTPAAPGVERSEAESLGVNDGGGQGRRNGAKCIERTRPREAPNLTSRLVLLWGQIHRYAEWCPWEEWRNTPIRLGEERPVGVELYDHATDPDENQNVAATPEHQEVVSELSECLARGWRGEVPS